MGVKIGSRVGVICKADEETMYMFGYGTYVGDEVPTNAVGWMPDLMRETGITNPKLVLDNGDVVWGCESYWSAEQVVKEREKQYSSIVMLDINKYREEVEKGDAEINEES